jgi:hypothetical protein
MIEIIWAIMVFLTISLFVTSTFLYYIIGIYYDKIKDVSIQSKEGQKNH